MRILKGKYDEGKQLSLFDYYDAHKDDFQNNQTAPASNDVEVTSTDEPRKVSRGRKKADIFANPITRDLWKTLNKQQREEVYRRFTQDLKDSINSGDTLIKLEPYYENKTVRISCDNLPLVTFKYIERRNYGLHYAEFTFNGKLELTITQRNEDLDKVILSTLRHPDLRLHNSDKYTIVYPFKIKLGPAISEKYPLLNGATIALDNYFIKYDVGANPDALGFSCDKKEGNYKPKQYLLVK